MPTEDLLYLQDQYDDWKSRVQIDTKPQETYLVQICLILLDIYKARMAGKHKKRKKKRTADQDKSFEKSLRKLIESLTVKN